jgi:hypothetical protein
LHRLCKQSTPKLHPQLPIDAPFKEKNQCIIFISRYLLRIRDKKLKKKKSNYE